MGKLTKNDLKKMLSCIKKNPKVTVGPQFGFDAGVHNLNQNEYLVVSTDPCLGVPEEWFGWLLINYVASDIALFGAKTDFCTINLLGPTMAKPSVFQKVMKQCCDAADGLEISIIAGHTGTYDGISTLVGVCTGYGSVHKNRLITPAGAKPRDYLICIKPVGLEVSINFAIKKNALAEKLFGVRKTKELKKLVPMQSCVKEALLLANLSGVNALHDVTEGGVIAALNEMAETSDLGFNVKLDNFLFSDEVHFLKDFYRLSDRQMLSMSSTGSILCAVCPEKKESIESILHKNNIESRVLGQFTKDRRRIIIKKDKETMFPEEANDPYNKIISTKNWV
jgi:hydrogenase expression/formation protein HypE